MDRCKNPKLGKLRYAYGLGMLDPDQNDAFEVHMMECAHCYELVRNIDRASEILRSDQEMLHLLGAMETAANEPVPVPTGTDMPRRIRRRSNLMRILAVAAIIAVVLVLRPWNLQFEPTHYAEASERRLVILFFSDMSSQPDSSKLGTTISNLLIADLSASQHLEVISSQRLADIEALLKRESKLNEITATAVAERAGARWMLTGNVIRTEHEITLSSQLSEVASGTVIASHAVSASIESSPFSLVDSLAARIRLDLLDLEDYQSEFDPPVTSVTTNSLQAYRWYLEGRDFFSKWLYGEAEVCFRKAVQLDSGMAMAHYWLAIMGDSLATVRAIENAQRASKKDQLYIAGLQAMKAGDLDRCSQLMRSLLEQFPDEKEAWLNLGFLAHNQGDHESSVEYFNKAIEIDPLYKSAFAGLAYSYNGLGDLERALEVLDRYDQVAGTDEPNPSDTRGEILAMNGLLDQAIESLEKVRAIKPNFWGFRSLLGLGRLYVYKQDSARATECFQFVIENGHKWARSAARTNMALQLMYQGRLQASLEALQVGMAVDEFEQATAGNEGDKHNKHLASANIYVELGLFDRAANELKQAIDLLAVADPASEHASDALYSMVLMQKGDTQAADSVLRALQLRQAETGADTRQLLRARGYTEFVKGNYDSAITYLESLRDASGGRGASGFRAPYLLARAYLATGRYSESIDLLELLLKDFLLPSRMTAAVQSVQAHYYLGLAYERVERYKEAAEQYAQFLSIWQNADHAGAKLEDARNRLNRLTERP